MNALDYPVIKQGVHSLKGASGYVGAGRVHYCCYHIQKAFVDEKFQLMIDYYPFLVEYVIEFKRFSRKYLAEHKSKWFPALSSITNLISCYSNNISFLTYLDEAYEEQPDAREIIIGDAYRL